MRYKILPGLDAAHALVVPKPQAIPSVPPIRETSAPINPLTRTLRLVRVIGIPSPQPDESGVIPDPDRLICHYCRDKVHHNSNPITVTRCQCPCLEIEYYNPANPGAPIITDNKSQVRTAAQWATKETSEAASLIRAQVLEKP